MTNEEKDNLTKQLNALKSAPTRENIKEITTIAGLFPQGYMTIIASPPGVGKTWISEFITCQLTTGGTILNGRELKAPSRTVLYLSGETGTELLSRRLAKTRWLYKPERFICYSALELGVHKVPYMLNTPEGQYTFYTMVSNERPAVLWIDTLISFIGVDESKQNEMTAIYLFLNRLARHYNIAVIVNHHTRKQPPKKTGLTSEMTQDDVIGTSAGIRLAHSVFILQNHDSIDESSLGYRSQKLLLRQVKSWEKKLDPILFEFTNDEDGYTDFLVDKGDYLPNDTRSKLLRFINGLAWGSFFEAKQAAMSIGESVAVTRYHLNKITTDYAIIEPTIVYGKHVYTVRKQLTQEAIEDKHATFQEEIPF